MTWLIALKDDPKDAELQRRIDLWCAASPENGQAYDEVNALWDLLGDLRDADGPDLSAQQAPEAGGNEGRMPVAEARRAGARAACRRRPRTRPCHLSRAGPRAGASGLACR